MLAVAVSAMAVLLALWMDKVAVPPPAEAADRPVAAPAIGPLRVVHTADEDRFEQTLSLLHGDKVVWSITEPIVQIGASFVDADQRHRLAPGIDLDGNGHPDYLVETSMGGRLGGYAYTWLEWRGSAPVVRDYMWTGVGAFHTVDDLTGDGHPELLVRDTQFFGWRTGRASSVAKDVIIRLTEDGFRVAHDLMARPAPPQEQLDQLAAELRDEMTRMLAKEACMAKQEKLAGALGYAHEMMQLAIAKDEEGLIEFAHSTPHPAHTPPPDKSAPAPTEAETGLPVIVLPPPELWSVMLDLIYTGHPERADKFLDAAWPATAGGKEDFRLDFWSTLPSGLIGREDQPQYPPARRVEGDNH